MELSNYQISGINLEAIKDENWFRFDEWMQSDSISQEIYSCFNCGKTAKLMKNLINFIAREKIPSLNLNDNRLATLDPLTN